MADWLKKKSDELKQYAEHKVGDFKQNRANSKEQAILDADLTNIRRLAAQVPECQKYGTYDKIKELQAEHVVKQTAYDAKIRAKGLVDIPGENSVESNAYYGGKKGKKGSKKKGGKKKGSKKGKKGSKKGSKKKK